jgi:hypothetical protein
VTMVNRNSPRNNQTRQILLQTATTVAFSQDDRDSIPVRVLLDLVVNDHISPATLRRD